MTENPSVRYVDAFPVEIKGKKMIYLRDPEGLAAEMAVPSAVYFLMAQMNGSRSPTDLLHAFAEQFKGASVSLDEVSHLIKRLDEALLLDNARSQNQRQNNEVAFRQASVRPAAHAGQSYPSDEKALREMIDGFFDKGPGRPSDRREGHLKALIAPHIDFNRGGPCFAYAYKALAESVPPDLFVVLGTGHAARRPFVMSRKDFQTPFGTLCADRDTIDRVAEIAPLDVFDDELAHKEEHAIEFQAVFLKYLYPDSQIPFVPILCGSFHEMVEKGKAPQSEPVIRDFVGGLRQVLEASGKRVCFISGVDLSHVGQRFGDAELLDEEMVSGVEKVDRALLDRACALDPDGYFDIVIRESDRTRVCGTSSIYTMLQLIDASRSELLQYDHIVDYETQQMVSFASVAFH
ncbi:MAG: AmmeMemoRadiSam system protein B [bacterium]|nr:AmmeMemoRadiSam system protein B [bacterium]